VTAILYSTMKTFTYPDRLAALQAGRVAAPLHIRIKPTNVCNHACYFCAYRNDNMSLGQDMVVRDRIPREKMAEIVEDIIAMGVAAVTFTGGGEPMIYPYFAETVNALAEGKVKIGSLTNASRLQGAAAEALAAHGTWVRVSIDGWDGPSYAKYRSVAESEFAKVMANLKAFAARGSACELGASIIIDETNAGHVFELCRQLKDCGVRHAKLSPCILKDSGVENNAYHARFGSTVAREAERAQGLSDARFTVVDHYHDMATRFDKSYTSCPFNRMLTVIGADCTVYTCQDKAYTRTGIVGSIKERRFRDLWLSDEGQARLCGIDPSQNCRHHCVSDSKNRMLTEFLALDQDHAAFV